MVGIYKITSPSGKIYIGQSWCIEKRHKDYLALRSCETQKRLYNSFLKYGVKNHKFEICHELPKDVEKEILDRYESLYIQQYKDCGIELMNLRDGGSRGKHSEYSKKLMSDSAKRNPPYNMLGKNHSEESKLKISLSNKGKHSEFLGKYHTEEAKLKISNSKKNKKAIKVFDIFGKYIGCFESVAQAGRTLNVNASNISACLSNRLKQTKNFTFKLN